MTGEWLSAQLTATYLVGSLPYNFRFDGVSLLHHCTSFSSQLSTIFRKMWHIDIVVCVCVCLFTALHSLHVHVVTVPIRMQFDEWKWTQAIRLWNKRKWILHAISAPAKPTKQKKKTGKTSKNLNYIRAMKLNNFIFRFRCVWLLGRTITTAMVRFGEANWLCDKSRPMPRHYDFRRDVRQGVCVRCVLIEWLDGRWGRRRADVWYVVDMTATMSVTVAAATTPTRKLNSKMDILWYRNTKYSFRASK